MSEHQRIVELTLVHGTSNLNGRHSAIEISDPLSHAMIRVELDMETLGSLVHGGRGHMVRATFKNVDRLGTKLIRKTVKVFVKRVPYEKRDDFAAKLAQKYEVDGWIFTGPNGSWSKSDHGFADGNKREWIRLHFKKYVKVKDKP